MLNRLKLRLRALFHKTEMEQELEEELRFHLEQEIEQNLERGMNPEEARSAALRSFGGMERVKEESRDARGVRFVEELWQDVRYGLRMLRRSPAFTTVAVLTLALGIGPITAIFTVARAVLFKPLPFPESERLVRIAKYTPESQGAASMPDFFDWRNQNQVCEHIGLYSIYSVFNLLGEGEPVAIQGSSVSAGLLAALGVKPLLGRWFLPGEDEPGASRMVVLHHELWQQRFNRDPKMIGRQILFDAQPYTVIGVMPPDFEFPISPTGTRLWANSTIDPNDPNASRRNNVLNVIVARLKPGVSFEQAQATLQAVIQPQYTTPVRVSLMALRDQVVGDTRTPLLILLGAIACVLLIACANVANLLLVRAAARHKEIAVRTALGASQSRLFRQLLTESWLLSSLGGALGLLLASLSLNLLLSFSPITIPRVAEVGIDGHVLGFLSLIVLVTGMLFGTLSVFRLSEQEVREALKEGTGRATSGLSRRGLRSALVVAELALSLVLLLGTGLLLRSFLKLQAIDPGFKPEGVLCLNVTLPQGRYAERNQRAAFIQQTTERLATLPHARAVAAAAFNPWTMGSSFRRFAIEGQALPDPGQGPQARYASVSSAYFRTFGIPLLAGRAFAAQDDMRSPGVAIVNQTFARRFFPSQEALGQRIRFISPRDPQPPWLEIVGIAGDVKEGSLEGAVQPEIQVPLAQNPSPFMTFFVRTDGDPLSLTNAAKSAIQAVDKNQPIAWITTLAQVLANSLTDRRGMMFLLGVFAVVALLLAAVGIYGVMSYSVSQRRHEIGIRMALGAQRREVLKLIVGQGIVLTLIGISIGLATAFALTRVMASLLFNVSATDPLTFGLIALLLMAVALVACWIPARRATKVEPMVALRYE